MKINEEFRKAINKLDNDGRFPHAILVSGDNRLEFSMFIASYLLCKDENNRPCNKCLSCNKIKQQVHPDVSIIDGGVSYNSFHIDKIRDIKEEIYVLPNESDVKIYILKDSQNMTEQAQNALLKILEEPPSFVVFILLADNPKSLLDTILSRVVSINVSSDNKQEQIKDKEKYINLANEIASCATKNNNYELLLASSVLIKSKDKLMLKSTFDNLLRIFTNSILIKASMESNDDISLEGNIAKIFSLKQINDIIELINTIIGYIKCNANKNLLITYFCDSIKNIKG